MNPTLIIKIGAFSLTLLLVLSAVGAELRAENNAADQLRDLEELQQDIMEEMEQQETPPSDLDEDSDDPLGDQDDNSELDDEVTEGRDESDEKKPENEDRTDFQQELERLERELEALIEREDMRPEPEHPEVEMTVEDPEVEEEEEPRTTEEIMSDLQQAGLISKEYGRELNRRWNEEQLTEEQLRQALRAAEWEDDKETAESRIAELLEPERRGWDHLAHLPSGLLAGNELEEYQAKIPYREQIEQAPKKPDWQLEEVVLKTNEQNGREWYQISGQASSGRNIFLFIYSDPLVARLRTNQDGSFSYYLEQDLAEGEHIAYLAEMSEEQRVLARSSALTFQVLEQGVFLGAWEDMPASVRGGVWSWPLFGVLVSLMMIILGLGVIFSGLRPRRR